MNNLISKAIFKFSTAKTLYLMCIYFNIFDVKGGRKVQETMRVLKWPRLREF